MEQRSKLVLPKIVFKGIGGSHLSGRLPSGAMVCLKDIRRAHPAVVIPLDSK